MARKKQPKKIEEEPKFYQHRPVLVEEVNVFKVPVSQDRPFLIPGTDLGVSQNPDASHGSKTQRQQDLLVQVQNYIELIKENLKSDQEANKDYVIQVDEIINEENVQKMTYKQRLKLLNQLVSVRKTIKQSLNKDDMKQQASMQALEKEISKFQQTAAWMDQLTSSRTQQQSVIQQNKISMRENQQYEQVYKNNYGPNNQQQNLDANDLQNSTENANKELLMGNRNPIYTNSNYLEHLPVNAEEKHYLMDKIINVIDNQQQAQIEGFQLSGQTKIKQLEHCEHQRDNRDKNDYNEMYRSNPKTASFLESKRDDGTRESLVQSRNHDSINQKLMHNYSIHQNDDNSGRQRSLDYQIKVCQSVSQQKQQNSKSRLVDPKNQQFQKHGLLSQNQNGLHQSQFNKQLNHILDPHTGQLQITRDQFYDQIVSQAAQREHLQTQAAVQRSKCEGQNLQQQQKSIFDEDIINQIQNQWRQEQLRSNQQQNLIVQLNRVQGPPPEGSTANRCEKMVQSGRADNDEICEFIHMSRMQMSNQVTTKAQQEKLQQNQSNDWGQNKAQLDLTDSGCVNEDMELSPDRKAKLSQNSDIDKAVGNSVEPKNRASVQKIPDERHEQSKVDEEVDDFDESQVVKQSGASQNAQTGTDLCDSQTQMTQRVVKLPAVLPPFLEQNVKQIQQIQESSKKLHESILKSSEENFQKIFDYISDRLLDDLLQTASNENLNLFLKEFK